MQNLNEDQLSLGQFLLSRKTGYSKDSVKKFYCLAQQLTIAQISSVKPSSFVLPTLCRHRFSIALKIRLIGFIDKKQLLVAAIKTFRKDKVEIEEVPATLMEVRALSWIQCGKKCSVMSMSQLASVQLV